MKLKLKEGILIQEVAGEKILMASGMEEVVAKDVEEWLEQLWELRVLEKTDC